MSEDPTKRFTEDGKMTQPMLDSLFERINTEAVEQERFRAEMRHFIATTDERLEHIEIDLDKTPSVAHDTRADVRELRERTKETV
jgi:hypothetical protein